MPISQNASFQNKTPYADFYYACKPNSGTAWDSVSQAHAGIPEAYRSGGKIIFISSGSNVVLYCYQGGTTEADLKPISGGGSGGGPTDAGVALGSVADLQNGLINSEVVFVSNGKKSGFFRYDPTDTSSQDDNGALVIVGGENRYKRVHSGTYFPEWFDAIGDGVTNDYLALKTMFDKAAAQINITIRLENNYSIETGLLIRNSVEGNGTIFTKATAVLNVGRNGLTLKDFKVDGLVGTVATGSGLLIAGPHNITVQNVRVSNVNGPGISITGSRNSKITQCTVKNCRGLNGDGIYFAGCENIYLAGNNCTEFERIGIAGEQSSGGVRSKNCIIIGNHLYGAIQTTSPSTHPNGGIWIERVDGGIISSNTVENTFARGIVINRNATTTDQFMYIIDNNTIRFADVGITLLGSVGQYGQINDCQIIDCKKSIDVGYVKECSIFNVQFLREKQPLDYFMHIINFIPNLTEDLRSSLSIKNCKNAINNPAYLPVGIPDVFNNTGHLTISDCEGNFAFAFKIRKFQGNIKVKNTLLDYTAVTTNDSGVVFARNAEFVDCEMILSPTAGVMYLGADKVLFKGCSVTCTAPMALKLGTIGPNNLRIQRSTFNNVYFTEFRRTGAKIQLLSSEFDGYHGSTGLFDDATVLVDKLDVRDCTFSETSTVIPLRFTGGVTTANIGHNTYISSVLHASQFMAKRQSVSHETGTRAQRPVVDQVLYRYFDQDIKREIYWNGDQYIGPVTAITDLEVTTGQTKTGINNTLGYGKFPNGTRVRMPNVPNGRTYEKLSDAIDSDWMVTVWSTGVTTLLNT